MEQNNLKSGIKHSVLKLSFVTVLMFGFGFAMVPLYNVFCEVTGLNGKTGGQVSEAGLSKTAVDESRTITVQFITNLKAGLPWRFGAAQYQMEVHPGKVYEAYFYAENRADYDVTGQAIPSVSPGRAAVHFSKTECFCFTQQTLKAGEKRDMPLRFVVNPELPEDVEEITLSYTFFQNPKS